VGPSAARHVDGREAQHRPGGRPRVAHQNAPGAYVGEVRQAGEPVQACPVHERDVLQIDDDCSTALPDRRVVRPVQRPLLRDVDLAAGTQDDASILSDDLDG
jgi:hypothetical protein